VGKDPAWAGQDGRWIAYVTGSGPAEAIWAADVSGGKPPFRVAAGCMPSWSSDGKTLFFAAFDQGQLMSAEVTSDGQFSPPKVRCAVPYRWPDVSPDGKRVAYNIGDTLVIQQIDDGKVVKRFAQPKGNVSGGWSPDSREFGFGVWNPMDPTPCFILDVEASLARRVEPRSLTMPAWSPDGTKITFDRRLITRTEIWIFDAEAIKKLPTFKMEAR
jgi:Tol biopolymer transport system component